MKKPNFFKIIISVCSGTKIFPEIIKKSVFRSLWHLILLAVICALVFVGIRTPQLESNISKATDYLAKEFGSAVVQQDGVFPKITPEKARKINYDFVQIDYYPKLPAEKDFKLKDKLNNIGFVWLPSGVTGWLKMSDNKYIVYQGMASQNAPQWFSVTDEKGIYNYLENNKITNFDSIFVCLCAPLQGDIPLFMLLAPLKSGVNNFSDFTGDVYWYSTSMAAVKFFLMVVFNALFYSLIFAVFFSISGKRNPQREFTFKTAFNTAIYAGFPAIVIGTLFAIAKFPWLEYQTIYLLAMFIYLIVITQKKRNRLNPGNQ